MLFKFGDDRFRGYGLAEGQILHFPMDFEGRPYNTHTIMWGVMQGQTGRRTDYRTCKRRVTQHDDRIINLLSCHNCSRRRDASFHEHRISRRSKVEINLRHACEVNVRVDRTIYGNASQPTRVSIGASLFLITPLQQPSFSQPAATQPRDEWSRDKWCYHSQWSIKRQRFVDNFAIRFSTLAI